jgi:tetratricopeptide (TPR) repeat protein
MISYNNQERQDMKQKPKTSIRWAQLQIPLISITCVILFCIIIGCGSGGPVGKANKGVRLLQDGKYTESEIKFRDAQRDDPTLGFVLKSKTPAMVYIGLGNSAFENGDLITSARNYLNAFSADSTVNFKKYSRFTNSEMEYPDGMHVDLGNYFWGSNNLTLAELAYMRALETNPESRSALTNLGNIERKRGNRDGAMKKYLRALATEPAAFDPRINMVSLAFTNKDGGSFTFHLEKLKQYHPDNPLTIFFQAELEKLNQNYPKALEYFEKYLKSRPDDANAQLSIIDCYLNTGKYDDAQAMIAGMIQKFGALQRFQGKALIAAEETFKKEEYAKALEYYKSFSNSWQSDPEFQFGMANCLMKLEKIPEARTIMEDLIQRYPESSQVLSNLGLIYVKMGKLEWAKEQFETAIQIDSAAIAFYNLGKIHEAQGDSVKANSMYIIAAVKEPEMFGLEEYLMNLSIENKERIARGDTAGMIFLDKDKDKEEIIENRR